MLSKKDFITELYKRTIKDVTSDSVAWRAFLHSASYQYKYPFEDQVLIYAQRPFATACADFDTWHKEPLNRRINRGAKGIALMRERGGRVYLEHVFDAKDTNSPDNAPFEIWNVKPGYESEIIEALGNRFGYLNQKDNLTDAVIGACINLGQDNIQDYVQEMFYSVEGSFLDELDDDNLRYRLLLTVQASVSYMVLTRLGLDAETSVGAEAFEWVHEFNTPATVNILGAATADISEICLREIERTVRSLDKENRTFDRNADVGYNEGGKNEIEKGGHNDVELHDREGRDTVPDLDSARTEEPPHREVRTDEIGVLEEAPQRNVHDASDRSEVDGASARDGRNGESADFGDYEPTGDEPWGDGADESREPDDLGADDEQHKGERGGNGVDQSNLRISDDSLPPISDPQSLIQLLRHDDFLKKSKNEIVSFLRSDATDEEKTEFVKSAYTPFLFAEIVKDGTQDHLGYRADAEGLLLYEGKFLSRTAETRMDWALITKLINALITDRNYLDEPKEGQQLSLLDVDYGAVEDTPAPPPKRQFGISQEVIDEFLRLGGCTRKSSQRIYGFYRRANNQAENIAFLRKEYETDHVGIIVGDKKYAVKWNDDGVRISTGERVSDISSAFLTWEMVDKRIRELLEIGQYIPQTEAEKADEIWEETVADKIAFLYREDFENIPAEYKTKDTFLWPGINNFYRAILHDPQRLTAFVEEMKANENRVKDYPPRFRRFHNGVEVAALTETFLREPVEFPPADPYILPPKQFVTQDKIDTFFINHSKYGDSKLRTYSFFLKNKDTSARAKFLSDQYGVGGTGGLRTDNQHDGKGIVLYGGLQNRETGVLLKWSQVAKRIDDLIRSGKYLTEEEKAGFDKFERREIAANIRSFYYHVPEGTPLPFRDQGFYEHWKEVDDIEKQIESKERLDEIVEMMQAVHETRTPESRDYDLHVKRFENVRAYQAGKFNMFPGSPYRKRTPTKPIEAEVKQEPTEERKAPTEDDIPPSEYEFHLGTTVYIGKDECEIISIDSGRVELFDGTLIPLEMDYETFMSRVRENDLNAHLIKKAKEKVEQKPVEEPKRDFSKNPILSRYEEAKKAYPQHIAMVRVGDFYEFFGDDAVKVAKVLDLTLTSRPISGDNDRIPMCGIPYHVVDKYLEKLINADLSVAIFEDGNVTPAREETAPEVVDELERATELIKDFYAREYGDNDVQIDDVSKIPLAHTTTENEEFFVQVTANLTEYKIEKYLGEDLIEVREYGSLKELNDTELSNLAFDELVVVEDAQIEDYKRKHNMVIPEMVEAPKPKPTLPVYNSHPEIPDSEKHNYRITDDKLGVGGAKEKFKRNMAAINLLHELEFENRLATPEEQEILAQYTGWGGLSDAFDESKDNWASEFQELYTTLSPEEYRDAKESTLTAFYTPPVVIRAMYEALEKMGLKRGNILEPSCGTGNFMGMLPDSMSESKIYGVELDSLTGRIARQLYQKNGITIDGYEKTHFPDSFFDVAVGNVPFGQFKVVDKKYDKHNFLIHDYFFAKTLDKVRPGGVIAFVTSSGTLDKENPAVRKYLAQRADLIGAIRLPDTTFKDNAGTRVVSDIIFLQKRDRIIEAEPDWVHLGIDENGIPMNQYFIDNPDMVLGEMVMRSGPYGDEPTCRAYEGQDLGELLSGAIANINAEIQEVEIDELTDEENKSIPADPTVKNFSFTLVDGKVYYRQNSIMNPVETSVTGENRIKGMIGIRDTVRELIDAQLSDYPDYEIKRLQDKLNTQYDTFTKKYGLINSRANAAVFSDDNSYFLLCSLEILDENKELKAKADMFTKRTIKPQTTIDKVDTASEALAVSIGERAFVDMEYMSELTGKSEEELFADLKGVIFLNPYHGNRIGAKKYLMADEYLSGNVREKLEVARKTAELYPEDYTVNVEALERVQPVDLTAAEIGVKLGSVWVPQEDVQDFMYELLGTSRWMRGQIEVKFVKMTGEWVITNKTHDRGNVKAYNTYGTSCINAYQIIEETLNLKDVRIFDYVDDGSGKKKPVLNKKETAIAQGKQEQIKRAFEEWIWRDPERRERLCKLYNEKFNSYRPREYDGSHIQFYGMNPEITLRPHQKNAVARIMYGGNSLLAHVVGAGKTFTMVAAAQESKRLGLCNKSMFVVPNHLIEQWASEYLQLYPSANILVATKKDFETKNRKKFCARIATGDYDAIIIGHSQFEKIPVSVERQIRTLETEIETIMQSMEELSRERGNRVTVKQLAKSKKALETRLERLNDQSRKDDVVTFEELGVDRIFIDEAHFYKNLAAYTKMRNVAGISQTEAQKSSDLYMKCRYLDELTGGKGCVFATGTPISNTMVELYTMQKYLQYDELRYRDLLHFDSWASTFGETVTAIELAPDGTGYRAKTRFAKFFNIPELMAMFKQVADIQTADMLNLPTPEAHFHVVKVEASDIQKDLVQSFAERAEKIHKREVASDKDNMLLVTNDGRKAALDQRLINPMLEDFEGSKVNVCVDNIYDIWERNADKKSAQLVFCDLSTPKNDGNFNVYDDIRNKLIERGIPPEEIAFIHTADTDTKKKELFGKVRRGQVRILIGSTFKMGAGTNVQERLIALHDLDVPWRPSDLEQRAGRIVRQGNTNPEVDLYRYVTEGTFDAYSYQLLESKQKFISQIMTSKSPVRSAEDVDETALSYAEIKALASGNPKIMEKMQLDADVAKLKLQKASHLSQRYALEDDLIKKFPREIAWVEEHIKGLESDIKTAEEHTVPNEDGFSPMVIMGVTYTDKTEAEQAITDICSRINNQEPRPLGEYRGFKTEIGFDGMNREFFINLKGALTHKVLLGKEIGRIVLRIDNQIEKFAERKANNETQLAEYHRQVENAKIEIAKPFADEAILEEKSRRLDELNAELNMDRKENEIVDGVEEISEDGQDKKPTSRDDRDDR